MTLLRLIIKSILHFWKQHLALLSGVLLSTAILTGALITGDSVDYSLRKMVDLRLGKTGFALQTGDRFVRAVLADELAKKLKNKAAAILQNQGVAINPANGQRVNQAEILGIGQDFTNLTEVSFPEVNPGEAVISGNLAQKLGLAVGDDLILRMEKSSIIPVNAPFAEENTATSSVRLKVAAIAEDGQLGRFSLQSNQVAPYNIFIDRNYLQGQLSLEKLVNLILIRNHESLTVDEVNDAFQELWKLKDAGLAISEIGGAGQYELTSNRIFIDPAVADAVKNTGITSQPVLTYLVNSIEHQQQSTPYSFVTATTQDTNGQVLGNKEIIINQWLADDLNAKSGDTLLLKYFTIGSMRKLKEADEKFVVKSVIPLRDSESGRAFMPDFPGMANAGSCSDWKAGVPINLEAIRDKDEKFWDNYRGTPKGFISIEAGKKLWGNSFGNHTAFRFAADEISGEELESRIRNLLAPLDFGLQFRPVREQGLAAVNNAVDFGELFLSLSFFVIAAGILLTALLFSLHVSARSREGGTLAAIGFSRKQIIRFRMLEALLVIILGAIAGTFAGILYNEAIMSGLNSVWQDVVRTTTLWIHIRTGTLIVGAVSGIIIAFATIWFITRKKMKEPLKTLISKTYPGYTGSKHRIFNINGIVIWAGFGGSIVIVIYSIITGVNQNSSLFLPAGGLFLVGCVALAYRALVKTGNKNHTSPLRSGQLSLKNAARNPFSSLSTIILLALGTFTIIITGANQQTFYGAATDKSSGTGGYLFWAETAVPIIYDLNTEEGKAKYGLDHEAVLKDVNFIQFLNLHGDDASCLNLNQVDQPQILGIDPERFDNDQAFSFAKLLDGVNKDHPWLSLSETQKKGIIPAIADQTVITWGLMKKVGDTLTYLNEQGEEIRLLLTGGLKNSIFQGNILLSDSIFKQHFPSAGGTRVMLIDAPAEKQEAISGLLSERLTDLGIALTPATTRLATFNSVTNTYLSVFMILGGLGVLIGTIGLGIIILRNLLERRNELALLTALGFRKKNILGIVFNEYLLLLFTGMLIGALSAVIGILPSLLSPAYTMNTPLIIFILLAVLVSGLLWIYFPAKHSLNKFSVRELQTE